MVVPCLTRVHCYTSWYILLLNTIIFRKAKISHFRTALRRFCQWIIVSIFMNWRLLSNTMELRCFSVVCWGRENNFSLVKAGCFTSLISSLRKKQDVWNGRCLKDSFIRFQPEWSVHWISKMTLNKVVRTIKPTKEKHTFKRSYIQLQASTESTNRTSW